MRADPSRLLALALVLALGGPAPGVARAEDGASSPARGGRLAVTAKPERLVLGVDGAAELRIAAPPDVLELSVTASTGRIEAVTRLPGGGFTARYVAPAERSPRVAIVSALGRDGGRVVDGWLAIPLHGHGIARIRAAPDTPITLRIGDREYGPVFAGEDGRAGIEVEVPPGVHEGHHGFRPVELGVPETSRLHLALDRSRVPADAPAELRFRVYVVAPHGAARKGDVPKLEATRGTWAFSAREPGAFEGVWRLPASPVGEARLAARLPGAPASRASVRVEIGAAPPEPLLVAFDAPVLPESLPPAATPLARRPASVSASFSWLAAGAFEAPTLALAAERDAPHLGAGLRMRFEGRVATWDRPGADHGLATLLAGVALRRDLPRSMQVWGTAGAGVALTFRDVDGGGASHGVSPAAALGLGLGRRTAWGTPFVELGATGVRSYWRGGDGGLSATLGLGVRFDLGGGGEAGREAGDVVAHTR